MNYSDLEKIPEHHLLSMKGYIENGYRLGSCFEAIFANDLKNAVCKADEEVLSILLILVRFIYLNAPADCQGSYEKVKKWRGRDENK